MPNGQPPSLLEQLQAVGFNPGAASTPARQVAEQAGQQIQAQPRQRPALKTESQRKFEAALPSQTQTVSPLSLASAIGGTLLNAAAILAGQRTAPGSGLLQLSGQLQEQQMQGAQQRFREQLALAEERRSEERQQVFREQKAGMAEALRLLKPASEQLSGNSQIAFKAAIANKDVDKAMQILLATPSARQFNFSKYASNLERQLSKNPLANQALRIEDAVISGFVPGDTAAQTALKTAQNVGSALNLNKQEMRQLQERLERRLKDAETGFGPFKRLGQIDPSQKFSGFASEYVTNKKALDEARTLRQMAQSARNIGINFQGEQAEDLVTVRDRATGQTIQVPRNALQRLR